MALSYFYLRTLKVQAERKVAIDFQSTFPHAAKLHGVAVAGANSVRYWPNSSQSESNQLSRNGRLSGLSTSALFSLVASFSKARNDIYIFYVNGRLRTGVTQREHFLHRSALTAAPEKKEGKSSGGFVECVDSGNLLDEMRRRLLEDVSNRLLVITRRLARQAHRPRWACRQLIDSTRRPTKIPQSGRARKNFQTPADQLWRGA